HAPITIPPLSRSTLSPYTTLFRSCSHLRDLVKFKSLNMSFNPFKEQEAELEVMDYDLANHASIIVYNDDVNTFDWVITSFVEVLDRKSTRLNSSHVKNSYAVFCLK